MPERQLDQLAVRDTNPEWFSINHRPRIATTASGSSGCLNGVCSRPSCRRSGRILIAFNQEGAPSRALKARPGQVAHLPRLSLVSHDFRVKFI